MLLGDRLRSDRCMRPVARDELAIDFLIGCQEAVLAWL